MNGRMRISQFGVTFPLVRNGIGIFMIRDIAKRLERWRLVDGAQKIKDSRIVSRCCIKIPSLS